MELVFNDIRFSESHSNKNDFDVEINTITSYYKTGSKPPTIQINIGENDPNNFLKKEKDAISPKIQFHEGLTHIYFPIKKTKDKLI